MRLMCYMAIAWFFPCAILGQEFAPANQHDARLRLVETLSEDLTRNSQTNYETTGDATWGPTHVVLEPGASLTRSIAGGPWFAIDLELEEFRKAIEQKTLEFELRLTFDTATDCFLRLQPSPSADGPQLNATLYDTFEEGESVTHREVRTALIDSPTSSYFTLEYRCGLVTISVGGDPFPVGYIDNGFAVLQSVTCTVHSGDGLSLRRLVLKTCRLDELFPNDALETEDVIKLRAEYRELWRKRAYRDAIAVERQRNRLLKDRLAPGHPELGESFSDIAAGYRTLGAYADAMSYYLDALKIRQLVYGETHPITAKNLQRLVTVCGMVGEHSQAVAFAERALKTQRAVLGEEHIEIVSTLNALANQCLAVGDLRRCEQIYMDVNERLVNISGTQNRKYAISLINLATLYARTGRFARAEALFDRAIPIIETVRGNESRDLASALKNQGLLYVTMGELERAEESYLRAQAIAAKAFGTGHPTYAITIAGLAEVYRRGRDYERAESLGRQVVEIFGRSPGKQSITYAKVVNNLAATLVSAGDLEEALSLYTEASEIIKAAASDQHYIYGKALHNLANVQRSLGNESESGTLHRRSFEIMKQTVGASHPEFAVCASDYAKHYYTFGAPERAEALALDAAKASYAAARSVVPPLSEAAAAAWVAKQPSATGFYLSIMRRKEQRNAFDAYQRVWERKHLLARLRSGNHLPPNASIDAKTAFAELRKARVQLAGLVSAMPQQVDARQYQNAIATANSKKERLEQKLAALSPATERQLLIRDARIEDLADLLPEGVAVIDFVRSIDVSVPSGSMKDDQRDRQDDGQPADALDGTVVYDAFILRSGSGLGRRPEVVWVEIGAAEPIALAVARWRQQIGGERSTRALQTNSVQVKLAEAAPEVDPAQEIRRLVWQRIEPELPGIDTVIIIPDGILHRIPWDALPGREGDSYLIEDYAISTASFGQQLVGSLLDPDLNAKASLVVVGDIDYDGRRREITSSTEFAQRSAARSDLSRADIERPRWPKLKGAAEEARAVAGLWNKTAPSIALSGTEASETALLQQLPRARFAHLATHGFFDRGGQVYSVDLREHAIFKTSMTGLNGGSVAARNPLLMTGIVSAGANLAPVTDSLGLPIGDDGILTAEELVGLDLRNTELVTLSACESALGDVAAGEGVFGLQRALHQSGVRSVVGSLWKVDDAATRELMVEFYRHLWHEDLPKVEALRQAKLTLLKQGFSTSVDSDRALGIESVNARRTTDAKSNESRLHPRYWAAFQLSGDWR